MTMRSNRPLSAESYLDRMYYVIIAASALSVRGPDDFLAGGPKL